MGDLKEQMVSRPRESGGKSRLQPDRLSEGLVLCQLLELHESRDDYALVVERHDDVVALDSPTTPRCADFTQVKTKDSGAWTVTQLLKVEKSKAEKGKKVEKKMSFLAKMYGNRLVCEGHEITASFVSNVRFGVTLANGEDGTNRVEICFSDLCGEELSKVKKGLKDEHALKDEPDCGRFMYLKVADLCLMTTRATLRGRSPNSSSGGTAAKQPVAAFYRTLFGHVKRKTNHEAEITCFDDLLARKAITKAEFQEILDKLPKPRNLDAVRSEISGQLRHEGMAASTMMGIFDDWKLHEVGRMDQKNTTLHALIHAANDAADAVKAEGGERSLTEMLEAALAMLAARPIQGAELFKRTYRMAVLLMRLYGY